MPTLTVNLGERSYPIYIEAGVLQHTEILHRHIHGKQVMIVTNNQLAPLYLSTLQKQLADYQCNVVIVPDGESYKTLEQTQHIISELITHHHERSTTLIALGGGVIGDITGFTAAIYLRGVNFLQIPTSLLAQVDAAIGGKTAVNHALGKNLIGAFYQPQCVIIDPNTLLTLPDRELRAGLAEVIKYGLLADETFFTWLENNIEKLLSRDMPSLIHAIQQSCEIKSRIVSQDERDEGIRAFLNLGHTFAHAIEQLTEYSWLHGEAVAAGIIAALKISQYHGNFTVSQTERVSTLLEKAGLPVTLPSFSTSKYLEVMQRDKKIKQGNLSFILLHEMAKPYIAQLEPEVINKAF